MLLAFNNLQGERACPGPWWRVAVFCLIRWNYKGLEDCPATGRNVPPYDHSVAVLLVIYHNKQDWET